MLLNLRSRSVLSMNLQKVNLKYEEKNYFLYVKLLKKSQSYICALVLLQHLTLNGFFFFFFIVNFERFINNFIIFYITVLKLVALKLELKVFLLSFALALADYELNFFTARKWLKRNFAITHNKQYMNMKQCAVFEFAWLLRKWEKEKKN